MLFVTPTHSSTLFFSIERFSFKGSTEKNKKLPQPVKQKGTPKNKTPKLY
jgi:hypothetical protein